MFFKETKDTVLQEEPDSVLEPDILQGDHNVMTGYSVEGVYYSSRTA
jgi:hypothetical protein